jgi:hypothetical protein
LTTALIFIWNISPGPTLVNTEAVLPFTATAPQFTKYLLASSDGAIFKDTRKAYGDIIKACPNFATALVVDQYWL